MYNITTVYGTVCGASVLMISTALGVASSAVYSRCKHKGTLYKWSYAINQTSRSTSAGNTKCIPIELEQNNAYGVIKTLAPSLAQENMELCPAYEVL